MTTDEETITDEPLVDASEDQLHRGHIVRLLVDQVEFACREAPSSVIALTGAWGAGKTSILNIAKAKLRENSSFKLVDFAPWLFSDLASLVAGFFESVKGALPGRKFEGTRAKLSKYSSAAAPLGKVPALVGGPDVSAAIKGLGDLLADTSSLEKKRNSIESDLRKIDHKVIIFIDDLDRLHPEELLLVFKLIRSIARFPNVYYVLSFDEHTILDLLSATDLARQDRPRASAYIEKIVQAKVQIPPLHEEHHEDLFLKGIQSIVKRTGQEISQTEVSDLYYVTRRYLSPWLGTPRSIRKLFTEVRQSWASLAGEVNFHDNFLISFLRIYEPALYNSLSELKSRLTGASFWDFSIKVEPADQANFWKAQLFNYDVPEVRSSNILGVLGKLFSSAAEAETGVKHQRIVKDLTHEKRIESPACFDRYFQLTIPPGDVSDKLVIDGIRGYLGGDSGNVAARRLELELHSNPRVCVPKIHMVIDQVSGGNPLRLIENLSSIHGAIEDDRQFLQGSTADEIEQVVGDLLMRTSADQIEVLLDGVVTPKNSLLLVNLATRLKRSKEEIDWLPLLHAKLEPVLEAEVDKIGALPVESIDREEFRKFLRWGQLYGTEKAKIKAQNFVQIGNWSMRGYLGQLVGERTVYGSSGNVKLVGERSLHDLEEFLDVEFAITQLDGQIGQPMVDLSSLTERPSNQENREAYGLALLATVKGS